MNRRSASLAAAFVLAAALVGGHFAVSRGALAPVGDVVVLRCTETASEAVGIAQSDSSFGAPAFAADTSCAAALASLVKKGFKFQAVHGADVFLYTMVRP
ncbi:MAG TPA: hypothetical protein VGA73_03395 [Candidatus Binatia bacterium]